MLRAYKYRIYPNFTQKALLGKTFGCVRYFWNHQVLTFNSHDKDDNKKTSYKTSTEARNDLIWMLEVSAAAIQQKEIDFKCFKKKYFSNNISHQVGKPNLKKKSNHQSYRLPSGKFNLKDGKIRLEKIGWIRLVQDRKIPFSSKLMNVTVSQNTSGEYYVSVLVDQTINNFIKTNKSVGIDVGLKEFLVEDNGNVVSNPRYFRKSQAKLAKIQRIHSRKLNGSVSRNKTRVKIARLHQKISNQRSDFLHKESTRLVSEFDVIYIEDLNVAGMIKNHKLSKSISDVSWSKFFKQLEYKANWYGKELVKIGRFEASSKTCSCCGTIKKDLSLRDRTYQCKNCGLEIDRDLNASVNIKALGVNNAIRKSSEQSTVCDEAFSVI